jgi:predicted restriction endonuclease
MDRPCLGCGSLIERGSYCPPCDPDRERKRTTPGRRGAAAFRAAVLKRDGNRCRALLPDGTRCPEDDPSRLEAHHVKPLHAGGRDTLQNGVTLCRSHHRVLERAA